MRFSCLHHVTTCDLLLTHIDFCCRELTRWDSQWLSGALNSRVALIITVSMQSLITKAEIKQLGKEIIIEVVSYFMPFLLGHLF